MKTLNDYEVFMLVIEYHRYLLSVRSANPAHPLYARVIVGRIMQTECEYIDDFQVYRVTRLVRRYMNTTLPPPTPMPLPDPTPDDKPTPKPT